MRDISATIKKVLSSPYMEVRDLVVLTVPAYTYVGLSGSVFYPEVTLNMSGSPVVIEGIKYEPYLRKIGDIRFSLGNAPDNVSISVENVTRGIGQLLISDRKLDGTKLTVKRAFKTDLGWEVDTLFASGYVNDIKINSQTVELSAVAEMSRKSFTVGGRPVTQRCFWIFKSPECGWTNLQPGDVNTCDKGEDTANGCKAHGNITQFGAIPSFSITPTNTDFGGYENIWMGAGGGGYDEYTGFCLHPDSLIFVDRENTKKIKQLKPGDPILGVDVFGKPFMTNIRNVIKGKSSKLFVIKTKSFQLTCSPSHRLITGKGDRHGRPADSIKTGDSLLVYTKDNFCSTEKVESIEILDKSSKVITLELNDYFTFISGNESGGIVNHNLKSASYTKQFEPFFDFRDASQS